MRILLVFLLSCWLASAKSQSTPDLIYGELFTDVQLSGIFPDSKTFVDCIPKKDPFQIVAEYLAIKNNPAIRFSLQLFIEENFWIPKAVPVEYVTKDRNLVAHINSLWTVLRRKSDTITKGSSLLPLPYEYIIPGGRFREIYYWDSYFTMLGLKESKEYELLENMVKNFAYLIHQYGHIPNGNRSYYLSRSQPPFFSLMLELLASIKGNEVYTIYLPALEKEYDYWMDRSAKTKHLVKMPDGSQLNRYWDQQSLPRQESFLEDARLAENKKSYSGTEGLLYRNLRSAAESGWDFSSRWFRDSKSLASIQTINYIPVDLNCLLYHLESTIEKAYFIAGHKLKSRLYGQFAAKRKKAINRYCWSSANKWYMDYDIATKKTSPSLTLAGMFPFFLKLSDSSRMRSASLVIAKKFLKQGGVVTTLHTTGQQWDAPNGWAPLQWVTITGLENYGELSLAKTIASRWFALNKKLFDSTGKLMEKYDVVNLGREGGGGEYPSQDGFGWTNGVLMALINKYNLR